VCRPRDDVAACAVSNPLTHLRDGRAPAGRRAYPLTPHARSSSSLQRRSRRAWRRARAGARCACWRSRARAPPRARSFRRWTRAWRRAPTPTQKPPGAPRRSATRAVHLRCARGTAPRC
jgi:hypothetical protein